MEVFFLMSEAQLSAGCTYRHIGRACDSVKALRLCIEHRGKAFAPVRARASLIRSTSDDMTIHDIRDLCEMAYSLVAQQMYLNALELFELTEVHAQRLEVPFYPQRTETYGRWALCLLFMGRYQEATSKLDEIDISERSESTATMLVESRYAIRSLYSCANLKQLAFRSRMY